MKDKTEMHKYIIGIIFSEIYEKRKENPQIFIFFDSIDEIKEFHEYFKARVFIILYRHLILLLIRQSILNLWRSALLLVKSMKMERRLKCPLLRKRTLWLDSETMILTSCWRLISLQEELMSEMHALLSMLDLQKYLRDKLISIWISIFTG